MRGNKEASKKLTRLPGRSLRTMKNPKKTLSVLTKNKVGMRKRAATGERASARMRTRNSR